MRRVSFSVYKMCLTLWFGCMFMGRHG